MPRTLPVRDDEIRGYTVGVSGSADSGKTTLFLTLCRLLRDSYSIAVVTRKPAAGQDGTREFLIRHKALARARIVAVDDGSDRDLAIEWLTSECRPELIFVEDEVRDSCAAALTDFTIHVVNGSAERASADDAAGTARSDLLVLNKTHLGAPLSPERDVAVRESVQIRGAAPYVIADLRYGIGTIEIAKQFLERWRRTNAPAAWAEPFDAHVVLSPA
jgi:urease accessory protein